MRHCQEVKYFAWLISFKCLLIKQIEYKQAVNCRQIVFLLLKEG